MSINFHRFGWHTTDQQYKNNNHHVYLPVSSALVAPSLVFIGSTEAVGSLSSAAISFTVGALNMHSWFRASTSESGWICFSSKIFPSYIPIQQNVLNEMFPFIAHLGNAGFHLDVLQPFLDDSYESSRRDECAINARLMNVALLTKRECRMMKSWFRNK